MAPTAVSPDANARYADRRAWLAEYFDRTAATAWTALTSDAPVSGVRRTVREGRERMGRTLLDWLPADLSGARILDAGCGPGVLAIALARRGADVVGVDLAESLLDVARVRIAQEPLGGRVTLCTGDMLDPSHGEFDYVVAMDSLIHYELPDMLDAVAQLAARTRVGIVATFAPRTPLLSVMHAAGRLFPRGDRAPSIEPVSEGALRAGFRAHARLRTWQVGRMTRVASGFYTSQAVELRRAAGKTAPLAGVSGRHSNTKAGGSE